MSKVLAEARKSPKRTPLKRRKAENYFAPNIDLLVARIQHFHALLPLSPQKNPEVINIMLQPCSQRQASKSFG